MRLGYQTQYRRQPLSETLRVIVQKKRVCLALAAVDTISIVVFLAVEAGEAGEAVSC